MSEQQKRRGWMAPTVIVVLVLLAAGAGAYWFTRPSAAESPVAATTPPRQTATVTGAVLDPVGVEVCSAVDASQSGDVAAMKALGEKAAGSQDSSIRLSGMILRDQATLAEMHGGKGPEAVQMVAEAANLMTACLKGGYGIRKP